MMMGLCARPRSGVLLRPRTLRITSCPRFMRGVRGVVRVPESGGRSDILMGNSGVGARFLLSFEENVDNQDVFILSAKVSYITTEFKFLQLTDLQPAADNCV